MMEKDPFSKKSERIFTVNSKPFKRELSLAAGMTTRKGGEGVKPFDSLNTAFHVGDDPQTVIANRKKIGKELGFPLSSWTASEQVHGSEIIKIRAEDKGKGALSRHSAAGEADGMYTNEKELLLVSFYADCVPLIFYAPAAEYVGLAHAGWKGTALNIGGKFVNTWVEIEKINIEDIYAVIGPSISQEAYEVDDKVISQMEKLIPSYPVPWYSTRKGKFQLDMKEMNKVLLEAAGLPSENIFVSSHCTYNENELFFSHRRNGGGTGRMMSFIGLKENK
ncbi:peptidoglycan editing factor PgeF [Alteribacillus sp. YIM 98480]|uniref:peptidoglycan editing factor PgeF n=1 Tax=Alteribacillus sp. YIM 98480 TaxID=2606599 RepID=UPI00131B1B41|nr:peptidoglycan editing factor PgeF [Alteribacillus sp. YIM 98480]